MTTPTSRRQVAAVALGSNVGEREKNLAGAVRSLERIPGVVVLRRSSWIETEPVGGPPDQPDYLNGVVLIETSLPPRELLEALLAIERKYGRDRTTEERHGPRTLDLDLLFHGRHEIEEEGLILPHPRMEERVFVLRPLAELCPDYRLQRSELTVAQRLSQLCPATPAP